MLGDAERWAGVVLDAFTARPADEPVWDSLRLAFEALLDATGGYDDRGKRTLRLLAETPSLRARNLEKHLAWAEMLTGPIAERLAGPHRALRATTLAQTAVACFDLALVTWSDPDERATPLALLRRTFDSIRSDARGRRRAHPDRDLRCP